MSRQKMLDHLAAAEAAQAEVAKLEKRAGWALNDDREYQRKLARAENDEEREALRLYHIGKVLEGNRIYERAVGHRNSGREWAQTYALVLLANEAVAWVEPSM
jgi:hypothetical protein